MTTTTQPTKRGYTVQEAAAYLGIAPTTLRTAIRDNKIGHKRHGATVLLDIRELDRYFDSLPSERALPSEGDAA